MPGEDRKAAISAYKERKIEAGIYAVRCAPSGQIWVGSAPDVSTIQNRLWFTLRQGRNPHRALQDAWNHYGAEAVTFEIVDRLEQEEINYLRDSMLKGRLLRWMDTLRAQRI